jgi:hypothetical protein
MPFSKVTEVELFNNSWEPTYMLILRPQEDIKVEIEINNYETMIGANYRGYPYQSGPVIEVDSRTLIDLIDNDIKNNSTKEIVITIVNGIIKNTRDENTEDELFTKKTLNGLNGKLNELINYNGFIVFNGDIKAHPERYTYVLTVIEEAKKKREEDESKKAAALAKMKADAAAAAEEKEETEKRLQGYGWQGDDKYPEAYETKPTKFFSLSWPWSRSKKVAPISQTPDKGGDKTKSKRKSKKTKRTHRKRRSSRVSRTK